MKNPTRKGVEKMVLFVSGKSETAVLKEALSEIIATSASQSDAEIAEKILVRILTYEEKSRQNRVLTAHRDTKR